MQKIKLDKIQLEIFKKLEFIANKLENRNFFHKILKKDKTQKSLYIHSSPGRGKTMLMQKFYQKIKKTKKKYFHFNDFMYQIHKNLHEIRLENKNSKDELIEAVKRVVADAKLICFDEFQVQDIADAMLLDRIFSYIFSKNTTTIITSNSKPQNLYLHGLQREKFLDFVENILLKNAEIIEITDEIDYRLQYQQNLEKKYFLKNKKDEIEFREVIKNFTANKTLEPLILKVWGRNILLKETYQKIAIIDFEDFAKENFSTSDFKKICKYFNLIFLRNLQEFDYEDKNEARRFMLFIDEIYENKTALIILANKEIDKIYKNDKDKKLNLRTISRLNEIKSDHYFKNSKLFEKC